MEKYRTLAARKYYLLSCHRYFVFKGHKKYDESLVINITNEGGEICFTFTDLITQEFKDFKDPQTGEFVIPLTKRNKTNWLLLLQRLLGRIKPLKRQLKNDKIL